MQKLQIEKQLDIISQKKSVIANMQCIKKLKEVIQKYEELKDTLNSEIFQNILYICLKCNTVNQLPENFVRSWLQRERPQLYEKIVNLDISSSGISPTGKISLSTALYSYVSQVI